MQPLPFESMPSKAKFPSVTHPATFQVSAGSFYQTQSPSLILNQAVAEFSNGPVTVQWSQISGDAAVISNSTAVQPSVTLPALGYYEFRITVSTSHSQSFATLCQNSGCGCRLPRIGPLYLHATNQIPVAKASLAGDSAKKRRPSLISED